MKKQPIVQTTVETDSLIDSILEETAKRSEEKKPVKKTVKNRAKKVVVKLAQHPNLKDKEFITLPAKERIIHVLAAALKHNSNVQYYKSNYGNSHLYEENKKYIPTVNVLEVSKGTDPKSGTLYEHVEIDGPSTMLWDQKNPLDSDGRVVLTIRTSAPLRCYGTAKKANTILESC